MTTIKKAGKEDTRLLAEIGKVSFIESHGKSASAENINSYVKARYTEEAFKTELSNSNNNYYIIYHHQQPVGYSNIIFNAAHANIESQNVTKLERLYLLKAFHDLKLGFELFNFNIELSKKNKQEGMWLFVWKENKRAVSFYIKTGFTIVGNYDFRLTETHSNPNYQMFLKY